jgi:hypothetical protein
MEYYKKITLSNWNKVQEKYQPLISNVGNLDASTVHPMDLVWLENNVLKDLEKATGQKHVLWFAMMFYQQGYHTRDIHVDGWTLDKFELDWALNIPIINLQGEMFWYSGDRSLSLVDNPSGKPYLAIDWTDTPKLEASTFINSPTIVRVNQPHNVKNHSAEPRTMLSIRFKTFK